MGTLLAHTSKRRELLGHKSKTKGYSKSWKRWYCENV